VWSAAFRACLRAAHPFCARETAGGPKRWVATANAPPSFYEANPHVDGEFHLLCPDHKSSARASARGKSVAPRLSAKRRGRAQQAKEQSEGAGDTKEEEEEEESEESGDSDSEEEEEGEEEESKENRRAGGENTWGGGEDQEDSFGHGEGEEDEGGDGEGAAVLCRGASVASGTSARSADSSLSGLGSDCGLVDTPARPAPPLLSAPGSAPGSAAFGSRPWLAATPGSAVRPGDPLGSGPGSGFGSGLVDTPSDAGTPAAHDRAQRGGRGGPLDGLSAPAASLASSAAWGAAPSGKPNNRAKKLRKKAHGDASVGGGGGGGGCGWACPRCTFVNPGASADACGVCEAARDKRSGNQEAPKAAGASKRPKAQGGKQGKQGVAAKKKKKNGKGRRVDPVLDGVLKGLICNEAELSGSDSGDDSGDCEEMTQDRNFLDDASQTQHSSAGIHRRLDAQEAADAAAAQPRLHRSGRRLSFIGKVLELCAQGKGGDAEAIVGGAAKGRKRAARGRGIGGGSSKSFAPDGLDSPCGGSESSWYSDSPESARKKSKGRLAGAESGRPSQDQAESWRLGVLGEVPFHAAQGGGGGYGGGGGVSVGAAARVWDTEEDEFAEVEIQGIEKGKVLVHGLDPFGRPYEMLVKPSKLLPPSAWKPAFRPTPHLEQKSPADATRGAQASTVFHGLASSLGDDGDLESPFEASPLDAPKSCKSGQAHPPPLPPTAATGAGIGPGAAGPGPGAAAAAQRRRIAENKRAALERLEEKRRARQAGGVTATAAYQPAAAPPAAGPTAADSAVGPAAVGSAVGSAVGPAAVCRPPPPAVKSTASSSGKPGGGGAAAAGAPGFVLAADSGSSSSGDSDSADNSKEEAGLQGGLKKKSWRGAAAFCRAGDQASISAPPLRRPGFVLEADSDSDSGGSDSDGVEVLGVAAPPPVEPRPAAAPVASASSSNRPAAPWPSTLQQAPPQTRPQAPRLKAASNPPGQGKTASGSRSRPPPSSVVDCRPLNPGNLVTQDKLDAFFATSLSKSASNSNDNANFFESGNAANANSAASASAPASIAPPAGSSSSFSSSSSAGASSASIPGASSSSSSSSGGAWHVPVSSAKVSTQWAGQLRALLKRVETAGRAAGQAAGQAAFGAGRAVAFHSLEPGCDAVLSQRCAGVVKEVGSAVLRPGSGKGNDLAADVAELKTAHGYPKAVVFLVSASAEEATRSKKFAEFQRKLVADPSTTLLVCEDQVLISAFLRLFSKLIS